MNPPLINFKNGASLKKQDLSTNQSYCNYMSTSQAGGGKIYVPCNKFLKFVYSPISFAGGGGIYDLYCSPSTEGAVLGVASPSEEADAVRSIYSLCSDPFGATFSHLTQSIKSEEKG
ncbi:Hypothetical predicted protein [Xyrichtys novacula]|uniref:Uncharacterized protein n=1 Tax=Xyrichtys novacula TaxID=13765 RepID=A0AAV1F7V6_XYRNO|nr:Hypothetical predicted protein [Xyrichtys novacula]